MAQKADIQLVDEAKGGCKKAYSELVRRHQQGVLRLAMRFAKDIDLAEDITQEAFIKAYQKLELFEGRSAFKSWLYQIAVNTAKNKLRSMKHDAFSNIENVQIAVESEAEKNMLGKQLGELLKNEIEQLPQKQRTALKLRVFEDLSFKEIATIMDCPYDTAKANYRHGLMRLRHRMAESGKDYRGINQEYHLAPSWKGYAEVENQ